MKFVPDVPILQTTDDGLGFSDLVTTMEESFQHTSCPFVYGVAGDWGSGKTSIMRMLCNRLENSLPQKGREGLAFVPIWFDAWLYENEANVVYPLLHAIRSDLTKRLGPDSMRELENSFLEVAKGTILALTDLGLRTVTQHFIGEKLELKDVKGALDLASQDQRLTKIEEALEKWTDQVGELHSAFELLLTRYAEKLCEKAPWFASSDVRFVIFVDDLDRCLPETVVRILESIKNFLTASNCIFVLGINPRVVYQGIRSKYPNVEVDGREYLEKIINYSFYVPEPTIKLAKEFADKLFDNLLLDKERSEDMKNAFKDFADALKQSRFTNPRKIKRILNRYLLFLNNHGVASTKFSNLNTVRLIVLAEYFPSLFSLFLSSAEAVRKELYSVGEETNLKAFEEKYGVPLAPLYRQVTVMKDLFNFKSESTHAQLSEHVEAVFAITRSI